MPNNRKPEQIKRLSVNKLFGRFDHEINFSKSQNISIVTAPNGYGKTILLKILDSVFNKNLQYFWKIPFISIEIVFFSKKAISIFKDQEDLIDDEEEGKVRRSITIKCSGFGHDGESYQLEPSIDSSDLRYLERHLPVDQVSPDKWFDMRAEEVISLEELLIRYSDQLPKRVIKALLIPEWVQELTNLIDVHLVETQRLLYIDLEVDPRYPPRRRQVAPPPVVERDAKDLARRIGDLLQQYANESQKLDQTFPKRIIDFRGGSVESEGNIRSRLLGLSKRREELVSVGLLGKTVSDPIEPSDEFEDESIRRILSIYIEDTVKKLSIFDDVYSKISLFKEIVDEHFSFKKIEINSANGLEVIDELNGNKVPLSELSSGEQHELVLIYDLLFKVRENSIILIDEPELSLHVAWQKRFISDIQKILELKKLNVIIATHSPQIINDKWDLVQELAG